MSSNNRLADRSPFSRVLLGLGALIFVVTALSLFARDDGHGAPISAGPLSHQTLATSSAVAPCRWVFDKYTASDYEKDWLSHADWIGDDVCEVLAQPLHTKRSQEILRRVIHLFARTPTGKIHAADGDASADALFSRLSYRRECWDPATKQWARASGVGEELIEPLWGMLRDPADWWCGDKLRVPFGEGWTGGDGGQSKAHILPSSYAPWTYTLDATLPSSPAWSVGSPPWQRSFAAVEDPHLGTLFIPGSNILLDLGSSYFKSWWKALNAGSGAWFYDTFTTRAGLAFSKFVAVELESLSPDEAYKQLPADLVGAYRLINVGLDTEKGSKMNAISLLQSIAKPEDFTVFKLDIDGAPIELPIAHALRDSKELASLVSELFFEHHVLTKAMYGAWGTNLKEKMSDSYELFTALRKNGIRAHSWP